VFREGHICRLAKLRLLAGLVLSVVLIVTLFVLLGREVAGWTAGMRRAERGVLFLLVLLVPIALALLPTWLSWRSYMRSPRRTTATCRACQWSGPVLVADTTLPVRPSVELQIVEDGYVEGNPNPDFDVRDR
jgi:hypothetical protein